MDIKVFDIFSHFKALQNPSYFMKIGFLLNAKQAKVGFQKVSKFRLIVINANIPFALLNVIYLSSSKWIYIYVGSHCWQRTMSDAISWHQPQPALVSGHTSKYKFRENVAIHSPFLISFILFFDRETHVKMKICRRYREMLRTGRKIDDYAEN